MKHATNVEVLNSIGQVLQTVSVYEGNGAVQISGLAPGMYFVRTANNPDTLNRVMVIE
jgi:uncharacterized surface anchored protein